MTTHQASTATVLGSLALVAWALVDLSSLRLAVALALCLLVPGLGWARKLRTSDLGDTLALSVALSLCATTAVATTMAVTARWSPWVGLVALGVVAVLGFLPQRRLLAATLRVVRPSPTLLDQGDTQAWTDWYDAQSRRSAEDRQHEIALAEESARSWSDWYAAAEQTLVEQEAVEQRVERPVDPAPAAGSAEPSRKRPG